MAALYPVHGGQLRRCANRSVVPSPANLMKHVLNHLWREVWYLVTERVAPKVV
jgi:hypothetical protein